MSLTLSSRERLDLNLTTTFAELATTTLNTWAKQGEYVLQKARGSYAPYRISNRTGSSIFIWADADGSTSAKEITAVKIPNDETVDWRFDDWKTMREVLFWLSSCSNIDLSCSMWPLPGSTVWGSN